MHFVLGDEWEYAVGLLTAFGVICGVGQLAFNWTVFMRATNRTRPLFVAALLNVAVFAVIVLPATVEFGLTGFAIGFAIATFVQIIARIYFLRTLFPRFEMMRHTVRALAPAVPPVVVVLVHTRCHRRRRVVTGVGAGRVRGVRGCDVPLDVRLRAATDR